MRNANHGRHQPDALVLVCLTVPENRSDPDSRGIRLAVAIRKATAPTPKPDPIVFLTGGPGGTGLAEGPGVAKKWHPDRDVIFLDQRGALKSVPFLSCPEVDTFMEHTVELSWSDPATAEQSAAAAARHCEFPSGDHAGPEGARSATPFAHPTSPLETGWNAAGESVTAVYDACAADPACHAAFPDGFAEYSRVINDLAANPLLDDPNGPVDGSCVQTLAVPPFEIS